MDELLQALITAPHKLGKLVPWSLTTALELLPEKSPWRRMVLRALLTPEQEQERIIKAMVNKEEKAIILDQPDQIRFAQLCARKGALGLELRGLRRSRGQSAYAICKKAYGLKGSKQRVYEQMCELVEKVKRGDAVFPV